MLLSLLEKKKKDNSLLSFTRITEFTLGQISEALAHNKKRWGGHCSINFLVCPFVPSAAT